MSTKKKFEVGVCVTYSSSYIVEAETEEEALKLAKGMWNGKVSSLPGPCVDVDWDETDDIFEYEEE